MQNATTLNATTQNATELLSTQLDGTILVNELPSKKTKETKQPLYLKQGIKGKNLVSAKINTNKAIKDDRKTISSCLRDIFKNDSNFLESFANYNENDITPKNLLPLMKDSEGKNGFSCWLVMQLITRYYKNM